MRNSSSFDREVMNLSGSPNEEVIEKMKAKFGETITWVYVKPKRLRVIIDKEHIVEVASFLKENLGFDHTTSVSGVDYPKENIFEVVYHISSYTNEAMKSLVFALATRVPRDNPVLNTLTNVWRSAEYHERETFEMFGITFKGHPKLERLLLPEDWDDIPPLRKEFKLPGR